MECRNCHKPIADGSIYCNFCGRKQIIGKRARKRKRPRGHGSVTYDQRSKRYIARTPATTSGSGRNYLGAFTTYTAACAELDRYLQGKRTDLYNATFAKIYELWAQTRFPLLSRDSVGGYKSSFKSAAELHNMKFRELKTADYQIVLDELAVQFSRSKCDKVRVLFGQLCKFAMQNDVIDKNYAEFTKLPKAEKKEKTIFTNDELNLLWANSQDLRVQVILTLCYTGFRISELLNVPRQNVHIDEGYIVGGVKTDAGRDRIVPIIDCIKPFVIQWLNDFDGEKLLPFTTEHFRRFMFYPVLSELGIIDPPETATSPSGYTWTTYKKPRITPHSCRHTFASLSVAAGVRPEILQKIIGHSDYQTTANIYVHGNLRQLAEEIERLNNTANNTTN